MARAMLWSAALLLHTASGAVQEYSAGMKTFGHSVKNAKLPANTSVTVIEHMCGSPPCVVTQMHIPSIYPPNGDSWRWEEGIIMIELDGEMIQMTLLELALEGRTGASGKVDNNGGPWGTSYFGKTAKSGAVYSTIRFPFQKTLKVSIRASPAATGRSTYWMIVRGVESYRVVVGDVLLPATATVKLDRFGPARVQNLDFIPMASFTEGTEGVLFAVSFSAESPDYTYLEACMRLVDEGGNVTFLSSGAEDYFLSASYFDEGMFKTENSGLTFFDGKGSVSAYKIHDRDLVFTSGGGGLKFRVGETTGGCGSMGMCPDVYCPPGSPARTAPATGETVRVSSNVTYTTLVVRYEWPTAAVETASGVLAQLFTAAEEGWLTAEEVARAAAVGCPSALCARVSDVLAACGAGCFRQKNVKTRIASVAVKAILAV